MSVKLRLARRGSKHRPVYHIVAASSRCRRDGRFLEQLGLYDPRGSGQVAVDVRRPVVHISEARRLMREASSDCHAPAGLRLPDNEG